MLIYRARMAENYSNKTEWVVFCHFGKLKIDSYRSSANSSKRVQLTVRREEDRRWEQWHVFWTLWNLCYTVHKIRIWICNSSLKVNAQRTISHLQIKIHHPTDKVNKTQLATPLSSFSPCNINISLLSLSLSKKKKRKAKTFKFIFMFNNLRIEYLVRKCVPGAGRQDQSRKL